MYNKRKLSESKFDELKSLIQNAEKSNKEELDYLSSISRGLVDYSYKGKGDISVEFFSPKRNIELEKFLRDNIINKNQNIISIHLIKYREGSENLPHIDSNSSNTYLTLFQKSDIGGDLILEDENVYFDEIGQVIDYDGGKIMHGVTKIEKGYRETLVVWTRNKSMI